MLMTRPQRAFIMEEMTAWVRRKEPVRLARRMSSKSASFMRRTRASRVMPALLTRMWQAPRAARTDLAQDLMESSEGTSGGKGLGGAPGGEDVAGAEVGEDGFGAGLDGVLGGDVEGEGFGGAAGGGDFGGEGVEFVERA